LAINTIELQSCCMRIRHWF